MKRQWSNKETKLYGEVAKVYGKNESSIHEIVKKEVEMHGSFAITPQMAKVISQCLVQMEKALRYCVCVWEATFTSL